MKLVLFNHAVTSADLILGLCIDACVLTPLCVWLLRHHRHKEPTIFD